MEVTYHKEGEYYLPDLIVPEAPKVGRYHAGLQWGNP